MRRFNMRSWTVEGTIFVPRNLQGVDSEKVGIAITFSIAAADFTDAVMVAEEVLENLGTKYDIWGMTENVPFDETE